MKILFVASGKSGGVNPIVKNQGESLRNQGIEVDYFIVKGSGVCGYLKSIFPLRKVLRETHFDVVHAHYAWCGYVASLAGAKPLVVSLMGNDILDHNYYPRIIRLFKRLFHWKAVIVKSQEMRQRVGIPSAIVLPNGVNLDVFKEIDKIQCQTQLGWNKDNIHVLFLGRHDDARKNFPLAQASVNVIGNKHPEWKIEIHCLEKVKNEDTPILYNAADAAILPSFYEGSANALKEAMACGCPVVTTDMGDCKERLINVTGSAVAETYETNEVAQLLEQSILYSGKTNGRERILQDGIDSLSVANKLLTIYSSSINK